MPWLQRTGCSHCRLGTSADRVGASARRVGSAFENQRHELLDAAVRESSGRGQARQEKKSARKRGGQPGHPPHLKQLLPPERVTHWKHYHPDQCVHCHAPLPREAGPNDPEPKRFQTIEVPPIVAEVREYQANARTCPCCGEVTEATVPAEIRAHSVGCHLTALTLLLSRKQRRELAEVGKATPMLRRSRAVPACVEPPNEQKRDAAHFRALRCETAVRARKNRFDTRLD